MYMPKGPTKNPDATTNLADDTNVFYDWAAQGLPRGFVVSNNTGTTLYGKFGDASSGTISAADHDIMIRDGTSKSFPVIAQGITLWQNGGGTETWSTHFRVGAYL